MKPYDAELVEMYKKRLSVSDAVAEQVTMSTAFKNLESYNDFMLAAADYMYATNKVFNENFQSSHYQHRANLGKQKKKILDAITYLNGLILSFGHGLDNTCFRDLHNYLEEDDFVE